MLHASWDVDIKLFSRFLEEDEIISEKIIVTKFKGQDTYAGVKVAFADCHLLGACIPDPTKTVIMKSETGKGSCAASVYFLHCDGKYRNGLRQVLDGVKGEPVENKDTTEFKKVLGRTAMLSKSEYGE